MSKINSLKSFIIESIIITFWTKATFRILIYWIYHYMLWSRIYQRLEEIFHNNNRWLVSQDHYMEVVSTITNENQIIVFYTKSNIKIKVICDFLKKRWAMFFRWPKLHSGSDDYQSPRKPKHRWKIPTYKRYFSHSLTKEIQNEIILQKNLISWWICWRYKILAEKFDSQDLSRQITLGQRQDRSGHRGVGNIVLTLITLHSPWQNRAEHTIGDVSIMV